MFRKTTVGYVVAAMALLVLAAETQAIGPLSRLRSRRGCPSVTAQPATYQPACGCGQPANAKGYPHTLCAKFYFYQMGNVYIHYGGYLDDTGGPCTTPTIQMPLDRQYCGMSGCDCPPSGDGINEYCEVYKGKHGNAVLDPDQTSDEEFNWFEADITSFLNRNKIEQLKKWKITDVNGNELAVRLYKVKLSQKWHARLKDEQGNNRTHLFIGIQVKPDFAGGHMMKHDVQLKDGKIVVNEAQDADAQGTYDQLILFGN